MKTDVSSDNAKAQLGRNATFIWLIGGAILFLIDGGVSNLLSLRAAVFLLVGMFVAALIVGGVSYWLINVMAKRLAQRFPDPTTPQAQSAMRTWRAIFAIVNLMLGAIFVVWVYASFFWV
jgi:hypothetical protein